MNEKRLPSPASITELVFGTDEEIIAYLLGTEEYFTPQFSEILKNLAIIRRWANYDSVRRTLASHLQQTLKEHREKQNLSTQILPTWILRFELTAIALLSEAYVQDPHQGLPHATHCLDDKFNLELLKKTWAPMAPLIVLIGNIPAIKKHVYFRAQDAIRELLAS